MNTQISIPSNHSLVKPIEDTSITLPFHLDGSSGLNRLNDENLLGVSNDLDAITTWLNLYVDSPQTFRSYRKEIERLYRWCLTQAQKPFSSLTVEDVTEYWRFLSDPQPANVWCGPKKPRSHPDWKPFSTPLSDASKELAFTIIGRCFGFLTESGYLRGNPIKLMSKAGRRNVDRKAAIERYLPQDVWQTLWQSVSTPPTSNAPTALNKHERTRFLFALLYLQMPRVSEVVSHAMNSFYLERGAWWWRITGKGNKTRKVPVGQNMIEALKRYRTHRGLSPLPSPHSEEPLIASLQGERFITADMVYRIVKQAAGEAAQHSNNAYDAERLTNASTHWLRHTGLTHLADKGVDIRFLKASARHESLETTQRYLHIEDDQWHQAINQQRFDG